MKNVWIAICEAWQRVFRGYDDKMIYQYDKEMSRISIEVIDWYLENMSGIPAKYSEKEWIERLQKMKRGFELLELQDDVISVVDFDKYDELNKERMECMKIFAEDLPKLWD